MLFYAQDPEAVEDDVVALRDILLEIERDPMLEAALTQDVRRRFLRLRAVVVLDMSGLSRTTQQHGTVTFLSMLHDMQRVVSPVVWEHEGRIVNSLADSVCCVFPGIGRAVTAATRMQAAVRDENPGRPSHRQIYLSVGIGFGEVLEVGRNQIFGNEVNLAGKLGEDIADAGEILLSSSAWQALDARPPATELKVTVSGLDLTYHRLDLDLSEDVPAVRPAGTSGAEPDAQRSGG